MFNPEEFTAVRHQLQDTWAALYEISDALDRVGNHTLAAEISQLYQDLIAAESKLRLAVNEEISLGLKEAQDRTGELLKTILEVANKPRKGEKKDGEKAPKANPDTST